MQSRTVPLPLPLRPACPDEEEGENSDTWWAAEDHQAILRSRRPSGSASRSSRLHALRWKPWYPVAGAAVALFACGALVAAAAGSEFRAGDGSSKAIRTTSSGLGMLQVKDDLNDTRVAPGAPVAPLAEVAPPRSALEPTDALWTALSTRAQAVANSMTAYHVARTLNAFAMLNRQPTEALWAALGSQAEKVVGDMTATNVATVLRAFSTMGHVPGSNLLTGLMERSKLVAPNMTAQEVTDALIAFKVMDTNPGDGLLAILANRAKDVAPEMGPQGLANTFKTYAQFGVNPGVALLKALELRSEQVGSAMTAPNVANILNSYVKLEQLPGDPMLAVLGQRAEEVAPQMSAQDVAFTLDAYAMLKQQAERKQANSTTISPSVPTPLEGTATALPSAPAMEGSFDAAPAPTPQPTDEAQGANETAEDE